MEVIVHGDTTYYLVGTAHVSQRSVDEVRATIAEVNPDVVCVELDKQRYEALVKDRAFRDLNVFKVVREGRGLYLLAHLALTAYQRKIGASLGVKPGAELLAAAQEAEARGVPVELIDRDINVTLKRTWRNLGTLKRARLLAMLLFGWEEEDAEDDKPLGEQIEGMKEPEALAQLLAKLGKRVPEIKEPLIDERDRYLASRMIEAGAGKRKVVAVVGAAHVPGMLPAIGQPVDRAALERVPPPSLVWRILKWVVPLLFVAALIYGWRWSGHATLTQMLLAWILPTAICSAGLTLLVGGSPISAASALAVAPIAAIHPLLGTGAVVGLVEAWRRKPSVADCERLPQDLTTLKGFWKNPVTRILLVVVASGLGTAIGFWVGVGWVATLL